MHENITNNLADYQCTISVVSHGHGPMLCRLLDDLKQTICLPIEIIITFNILEDESFLDRFTDLPIRIIRNARPKGFGANHNYAFKFCQSPFFLVLNPDIRGDFHALNELLAIGESPEVGVCAPLILSSHGETQDSARFFPNLKRLIWRKLHHKHSLDYLITTDTASKTISVDWLAGMFLLFKKSAYEAIHGFDERYFLYVEDIDIAWRLKQIGYQAVLVTNVAMIHDAQHASRKKLRYFVWHLSGMLRFLLRKNGWIG